MTSKKIAVRGKEIKGSKAKEKIEKESENKKSNGNGKKSKKEEVEIVLSSSSSDSHNNQDQEEEEIEEEEVNNNGNNEKQLYRIPMNRISRIIKANDSDIRITQEAVFLINQATEKFLELFSKEAYACSFLDRKNHVGYQHLSSVVRKRKRFDFLSDFVPEKVKAEDALTETTPAET